MRRLRGLDVALLNLVHAIGAASDGDGALRLIDGEHRFSPHPLWGALGADESIRKPSTCFSSRGAP